MDKHKVQLIQRVKSIAQILDQLLTKKVINKEAYDQIRAEKTSQDQMRKLYDFLDTARAKEIFYEILVEMQPLLIEDLKNN